MFEPRAGRVIAAVKGNADLPRWALWLAFWLVFFLGCNMAAALADEGRKACDLEALKRYPMSYVLSQNAMGIAISTLYFAGREEALNSKGLDGAKGPEADAGSRHALAQKLSAYASIEHPIVMLAAGDSWLSGMRSLHVLLFDANSILVDELLAVLDAEGLTQHAALLREGKALPSPYHSWGTRPEFNADFKRDMEHLAARFQKLPGLIDEAVKRVAASRDLTAIYEPIWKGASEKSRLNYLKRSLVECVDPYDENVDAVLSRLSALPELYRQMMLAEYFQYAVREYAMHTAFLTSGNLMPEVETALLDWGLTQQAMAVRKGIAMFPTPYPRNFDERREIMIGGPALNHALHDLTETVDVDAIEEAILRVVRENDIIPK